MKTPTYDMPKCNCLDCGKEFDAATDPKSGARPHPGVITICLECGHVMAFADDLTVRPLTDSETIEIAGHPDIIAIQRARKRVVGERK